MNIPVIMNRIFHSKILFLNRLPNYYLVLLLSLLMVTSIKSEIIWGDSFQKGIETAKSKNTPIVLDLYTDWCGYCKILENKIFPEPEVSKLLENFITLRINAEEFPEIAKTFYL